MRSVPVPKPAARQPRVAVKQPRAAARTASRQPKVVTRVIPSTTSSPRISQEERSEFKRIQALLEEHLQEFHLDTGEYLPHHARRVAEITGELIPLGVQNLQMRIKAKKVALLLYLCESLMETHEGRVLLRDITENDEEILRALELLLHSDWHFFDYLKAIKAHPLACAVKMAELSKLTELSHMHHRLHRIDVDHCLEEIQDNTMAFLFLNGSISFEEFEECLRTAAEEG